MELAVVANFETQGGKMVVEPADFGYYSTKNSDDSYSLDCRHSDTDSAEFYYHCPQTVSLLDLWHTIL